MIKKFILYLSTFVVTVVILSANIPLTKAEGGLNVSAKSAYVCDATTGTLIYAKNEKEHLPIASMTKIMLLILAFEKNANGEFDFDKNIMVSKNASAMGGSQAFIEGDKEYKAGDLIKSIVIASANDSSVAIAEYLFGSEENAVKSMNDRAKKLGLNDTLFSNCTGLMRPVQYSCAKDVAIMLKNLIEYPKYFEYSKIYLDKIVHPGGRETELTNTNKLVRFYKGCDGGKTGYTSEAGSCLAATAKRGSTRIISVMIKEPDSKTRNKDCSAAFDYAFDNFMSKEIMTKDEEYDVKVRTKNGKKDYVAVGAEKSFYVFGKKTEKENIKIDFLADKIAKAPVEKGDILGKFEIYKDNVLIGEINAVSLENIDKLKFSDYVNRIAKF